MLMERNQFNIDGILGNDIEEKSCKSKEIATQMKLDLPQKEEEIIIDQDKKGYLETIMFNERIDMVRQNYLLKKYKQSLNSSSIKKAPELKINRTQCDDTYLLNQSSRKNLSTFIKPTSNTNSQTHLLNLTGEKENNSQRKQPRSKNKILSSLNKKLDIFQKSLKLGGQKPFRSNQKRIMTERHKVDLGNETQKNQKNIVESKTKREKLFDEYQIEGAIPSMQSRRQNEENNMEEFDIGQQIFINVYI